MLAEQGAPPETTTSPSSSATGGGTTNGVVDSFEDAREPPRDATELATELGSVEILEEFERNTQRFGGDVPSFLRRDPALGLGLALRTAVVAGNHSVSPSRLNCERTV